MTFDFPTNDRRMSGYLTDRAVEIARAIGGISMKEGRMEEHYNIVPYQTTHNTGGAIMGAAPADSVVNRYLQHWDATNLFVVGASAYPQNPGYNPTGTVGALAYLGAGRDTRPLSAQPRAVGADMKGKLAAAVYLGIAAAAPAQPAGELATDPAAVERGRAIVVGALGAENQQLGTAQRNCMGCHGMDGRGDGSAAFPRLAGQSGWYLYKQLTDYASGARPNDIMSPIAKALSLDQMEDVAAYYAAQQADYLPPSRDYDPLLIQEGGALAAQGSTERQIQACVNCHGPSGAGLPPVYPYLAGQYAGYTQLQLELWQQDVRENSPLGVMAGIAKNMTSRDIEAVAAYFETVRPPE